MKNLENKFTRNTVRGHLLIAGLNVRGIFSRSVVWISEFSEDGAIGFILNKPKGQILGECSPVFAGSALKEIPLYTGGPVYPDRVTVIAQIKDCATGEHSIEVGISENRIYDLRHNPAAQLTAFSGLSVWKKGQLENELTSESWILTRMNFRLIRNCPPQELWKELIKNHNDPKLNFMLSAPNDIRDN